jgi:hypothetical protein
MSVSEARTIQDDSALTISCRNLRNLDRMLRKKRQILKTHKCKKEKWWPSDLTSLGLGGRMKIIQICQMKVCFKVLRYSRKKQIDAQHSHESVVAFSRTGQAKICRIACIEHKTWLESVYCEPWSLAAWHGDVQSWKSWEPQGLTRTIWYAEIISKPTPTAVSTISVAVISKPWSVIPSSLHGPCFSTTSLQSDVYLLAVALSTIPLTTRSKRFSWALTCESTHPVRSKTLSWHWHVSAETLHTSFDSSNSAENTSKHAGELHTGKDLFVPCARDDPSIAPNKQSSSTCTMQQQRHCQTSALFQRW